MSKVLCTHESSFDRAAARVSSSHSQWSYIEVSRQVQASYHGVRP